jgi:hypothetical protein
VLRFFFELWTGRRIETRRQLRRRLIEQHRLHQDEREASLEDAGVPGGRITYVASLVRATIEADPPGARSFGLESLLDRYTEIVIASHRCTTELRRANVFDLRRRLEVATRKGREQGRDVLLRRIEINTRLQALAVSLQEEVDAIIELLQLYFERATMGGDPEPFNDDGLDQRLQLLAELDDIDEIHEIEDIDAAVDDADIDIDPEVTPARRG